MIQAENLTKKFKDFLAVDQVSLQVNPGEVLALLGPNGAGKTTTLRMLTSVLRPTSGKATVAGYDVATQAEGVRASVGILTEAHGLYGRMSAEEYLDFFGQIYRMQPAQRRKRVDELLSQFGLQDDRRRKIGEYSKGMRQKLALARALIHNPPVLLMDEPTSAMDPESARLVRDAIRGLQGANRAIIICTHNLSEAEELAGKMAIINHGRVILSGETGQLKTHMLGAIQFEVRTGASSSPNRLLQAMPAGVTIVDHGEGWLRYQMANPGETNPLVIQALVENNIPVLSLTEVPRSLETVYLQAISSADGARVENTASEISSDPDRYAHAG